MADRIDPVTGIDTQVFYEGTQVPGVLNITASSLEVGKVETAELEDGIACFIPGKITPGDITFTIRFDFANATHQTINTAARARTVGEWKILYSDGTTDIGDGFVSAMSPAALGVEEPNTYDVVVTPTAGPLARTEA